MKKLETGSSWIPCQLPGFSPAAAAGGCGHRPPRAPKPRPAAGGHARAPLSCGAGGPALPLSPPRVISRHPHLTRFSPGPLWAPLTEMGLAGGGMFSVISATSGVMLGVLIRDLGAA